MANKQDLQGSMSDTEICDVRSIFSLRIFSIWALCGTFTFQTLDLRSITSHHWKIWACSAVTGANLVSGLDWVVNDVAGRLYYSTVMDPMQSTKDVLVNLDWPSSLFSSIPTAFFEFWNGWMQRSKTQETLPVSYSPKLSWPCFWLQSHPAICILLSESRSRLSSFRKSYQQSQLLIDIPYPRQMPNTRCISANHITNSGWITSVQPVFMAQNPSVPPVFCEMLFSIRFHEPLDKLG